MGKRRERLLRISLAFGLCTVYLGLFAHLGVIGKVCSVIVVLPRHLQYYFTAILKKNMADVVSLACDTPTVRYQCLYQILSKYV